MKKSFIALALVAGATLSLATFADRPISPVSSQTILLSGGLDKSDPLTGIVTDPLAPSGYYACRLSATYPSGVEVKPINVYSTQNSVVDGAPNSQGPSGPAAAVLNPASPGDSNVAVMESNSGGHYSASLYIGLQGPVGAQVTMTCSDEAYACGNGNPVPTCQPSVK